MARRKREKLIFDFRPWIEELGVEGVIEQIGQKQKAVYNLRKAYTLNEKDEQVNAALSRMNIVPGPGLKEQSQLAHPPIPEGPFPEVDLSKMQILLRNGYVVTIDVLIRFEPNGRRQAQAGHDSMHAPV